jgi:hypothetical protein
MGSKRSFKELSPAGRVVASLVFAASVVFVLAAQRDIGRRSSSELRGAKGMWRLVCLNAVGAIAYFRWGRRRELNEASPAPALEATG